MSGTPKMRAHLVDRAAEMLGRSAGLVLDDAAPSPARPLPSAAPPPVGMPPSPAVPASAPVPAREPISLKALVNAGLVVSGRNRVSEEVTLIGNHVLAAARAPAERPGHDPRLVMVTSACPGEGKTFTALNVAAGMALGAGRSVLLVDADGKRGCIGELLGLSTEAGLRELAMDPSRRAPPLLIPTEHERLSILPYGPLAEGRSAQSQSLAVAVRGLALAFPQHIVVIDAPPCLSASEASILAGVVGQVLMVVQADQTQRGEVEAALDLVQVCPNLQLVLNGAGASSKDAFGAYDYGS